MHVLMRDEKEGRKGKQGQTNKAKQHSTPKVVTFPKKNELPWWVGLEPTTFYILDRSLYMYMYMCECNVFVDSQTSTGARARRPSSTATP